MSRIIDQLLARIFQSLSRGVRWLNRQLTEWSESR